MPYFQGPLPRYPFDNCVNVRRSTLDPCIVTVCWTKECEGNGGNGKYGPAMES